MRIRRPLPHVQEDEKASVVLRMLTPSIASWRSKRENCRALHKIFLCRPTPNAALRRRGLRFGADCLAWENLTDRFRAGRFHSIRILTTSRPEKTALSPRWREAFHKLSTVAAHLVETPNLARLSQSSDQLPKFGRRPAGS